MSTSSKKNIDEIFRKLGDSSIEPDYTQLDDIEIRLEKMKYYRFGWKHFNIYYTSIIVICFCLSAWVFADHLEERYFSGKYEKRDRTDSLGVADTVYIYQSVKKEDTTFSTPFVKKISRASMMINDLSDLSTNAADSNFSNAIHKPVMLPETEIDSVPIPKVVKPKKIVYVNKRDTIIKFDTTRIIRKR